MSAHSETMEFYKMANDYLHMRLLESGWKEQMNQLFRDVVIQRMQAGQKQEDIKFEQLYQDIKEYARDAISEDLEYEFNHKINGYLNSPEITTSQPVSPSLFHCGPSVNSLEVSPNLIPSDPSNVPSDIPEGFTTDEDEWQEQENSYDVDL